MYYWAPKTYKSHMDSSHSWFQLFSLNPVYLKNKLQASFPQSLSFLHNLLKITSPFSQNEGMFH